MTKSAEHSLRTTAELLADGNLELARRAVKGDEFARRALDIGIRASLLEARDAPHTSVCEVEGVREIGER